MDSVRIIGVYFFLVSSIVAVDITDPLLGTDDRNSSKSNGTFAAVTSLVDELLPNDSGKKMTTDTLISGAILGTLPLPANASYSILSRPKCGTLVFPFSGDVASDQSRTYSYTRNPGYFGEDSFSFSLANATSKATVMILVKKDENVPNYNYSTIDIIGDEDMAIPGDFKITGLDGNLTLSIIDIVLPKRGSLKTDSKKGTFIYTPFSMNFSGKDQFISQINGGVTEPSIITVNVTVKPVTGCSACIKALWQPLWGFWHYWNAFKNCFW